MVGVVGSKPIAPTIFLRFPPFAHAGIVDPVRAAPSISAVARAAWLVRAALGRAAPASAQTLGAAGAARRGGRVTYFIAAPPTDVERSPGDAELALWALESWQRAAGGALTFVPCRERGRGARAGLLGAGGRRAVRRDAPTRGRRPSRRGGLHSARHGGLGEEIAQRARSSTPCFATRSSISRACTSSATRWVSRTRPISRTSCTSSASAATSASSSAAIGARCASAATFARSSGLSAGDLEQLEALYRARSGAGRAHGRELAEN